jgi:hypothetical protein
MTSVTARMRLVWTTLICVGLFSIGMQTAAAQVVVEGLRIVSARTVGRTTTEYVARLRLRNDGPEVSKAIIVAIDAGPGTTFIDGGIETGPLPAGKVSTSEETVRFRQNRRFRYSAEWRVDSETMLMLSGVARTGLAPFTGARVVAEVSRVSSESAALALGRPLTEEFEGGVTDADGRYTVAIATVSPTDFVTLRVDGGGGSVLGGIVGVAGDIIAAAGGNSGEANEGQFDALRVTPISTAAWALGLQSLELLGDGDRFDTAEQWQAARQLTDGYSLLRRAAIIKALIENPALTRPAGFTNMLDLAARDSLSYAAQISLEVEASGLMLSNRDELLQELSQPWADSDIPPVLITYLGDPKNARGFAATELRLSPDGTGLVTGFSGSTPVSNWAVDASGRLRLTFNDEDPEVGLIDKGDFPCPNPSGQVSALFFDQSQEITRVYGSGGTSDVSTTKSVTRIEYPDCPAAAPEIRESGINGYGSETAVATLSVVPFSEAELAGKRFGGTIMADGLSDYPSVGAGASVDWAADLLDFLPGGNGQAVGAGLRFTWSVLPDGDLKIEFEGGEINRQRRVSIAGGYSTAITFANVEGEDRMLRTNLVPVDGSSILPGAAGVTWRLGSTEEQASYQAEFGVSGILQLDWILEPGGSGCRRQVVEPPTARITFQPALWSVAGTRVDIDYFSGGGYNAARYYEPLLYVPKRPLDDNSSGGYIVIEKTLFLGQDRFDPATVPGRPAFLRELGPAEACSK